MELLDQCTSYTGKKHKMQEGRFSNALIVIIKAKCIILIEWVRARASFRFIAICVPIGKISNYVLLGQDVVSDLSNWDTKYNITFEYGRVRTYCPCDNMPYTVPFMGITGTGRGEKSPQWGHRQKEKAHRNI